MYIDSNLKWNYHIDHLSSVISRNIGILNRAKFFLNVKHRLLLYNSLVLPYINYCCLIWGFTFSVHLHKIELLQKRAVRIVDDQHYLSHSDPIFKKLRLLKVQDIAQQQTLMVMQRVIKANLPIPLAHLFTLSNHPGSNMQTRNRHHFQEPFTGKLYRTRMVTWIGPRIWNHIFSAIFTIQDSAELSKNYIKKMTKEHFIPLYEG